MQCSERDLSPFILLIERSQYQADRKPILFILQEDICLNQCWHEPFDGDDVNVRISFEIGGNDSIDSRDVLHEYWKERKVDVWGGRGEEMGGEPAPSIMDLV